MDVENMTFEEKREFIKLKKYCIEKNFDVNLMLILVVTIRDCDKRQTWMEAINNARNFYESRPKVD